MTRCIEIQSLSKTYRIGKLQHDLSLREQLVEFAKNPFNIGRDER